MPSAPQPAPSLSPSPSARCTLAGNRVSRALVLALLAPCLLSEVHTHRPTAAWNAQRCPVRARILSPLPCECKYVYVCSDWRRRLQLVLSKGRNAAQLGASVGARHLLRNTCQCRTRLACAETKGTANTRRKKRDLVRDVIKHALVGRPNGTRALLREVIRDTFFNSTAPAYAAPSLPGILEEQLAEAVYAFDAPPMDRRGVGPEGPFFYDCDLSPTLTATRPAEGEIEEACAAMLLEGEREQLLLVRDRLKGDLAAVPEWLPDVHGDVRLLRFLRKCKGDCDNAVTWYRAMLAWRREEGVDRVRARLVEEALRPHEFPCHDQLQALMPVTLWSRRPRAHIDAVQVIYNGRWKTRGRVEAIRNGELTEAQFLLYWVYINEWLSLRIDALSRRHGRIAGVKLVCDMRDADPMRQFSKTFFSMMGPWASMSQVAAPSLWGSKFQGLGLRAQGVGWGFRVSS